MEVKIEQLFEAGAHFGHQTRRWNPKMKPYIFGVRSGVHILDLEQTVEKLADAMKFAEQVTASGGNILFVGTKRQAAAIVREEAEAAGMPYMTDRWLGGTLTNFRTIKSQVGRLAALRAKLADEQVKLSKKDRSGLEMEAAKLEQTFRGIEHMNQLPTAVYVADVPHEEIAVREAIKLGIPVIAIVDTNADPDLANQPIPANDDAIKTIKLVTHAIAEAAQKGHQAHESKAAKLREEESKSKEVENAEA